MFGFFRRRKPAPLVDGRIVNEDWQIGDEAVCICDSFDPPSHIDPRKGERLRVTGIIEGTLFGTNIVAVGLSFEGRPPGIAWRCLGFRKLRPDAGAADAEFTAKIKETRRVPAT